MSRFASATNEAEAAKPTIAILTFVFLDIPGDPVRVHSGTGTITWGGYDWLGVGVFGQVEGGEESVDAIATGLTLTLSGVDAAYITDAMATQYHRREVTVYEGFWNIEAGTLIDTPETRWSGFMDTMAIEFQGADARIELRCEHDLMTMPESSRMTNEDQKARYSGDVFLEFLPLIANYAGQWGAERVSGTSPRQGPYRGTYQQ